MPITIKSVSGRELFVSTVTSVRAAVEEAVRSRATLSRADLSYADLSGADLSGATLSYADLSRASLSGADLSGATLSGATLSRADLSYADLSGATLSYADLFGASLSGADLSGATLSYADLSRAKNIPPLAVAQSSILPAGSLIGWKKAQDGVLVKLRIPEDAQRVNATGRKCRADKAVVLDIAGRNGEPLSGAFSQHDPDFRYTVGAVVTPTQPFDPDRWNECSSGIHFFITREEAEVW